MTEKAYIQPIDCQRWRVNNDQARKYEAGGCELCGLGPCCLDEPFTYLGEDACERLGLRYD